MSVSDRQSLAVIRAVTQMGRDMGIPTLAEGVETAEQLALLRTLGCDAVQGYLIGRPARTSSNSASNPASNTSSNPAPDPLGRAA